MYDDKSLIIREIEKGDIKPISFPYNGLKLEPEPKPPTKTIGEKVKLKGSTKFKNSDAERKNQAGAKLNFNHSMALFLKNVNSI